MCSTRGGWGFSCLAVVQKLLVNHTSYLPVDFPLLGPEVCLPLSNELLWVWLLEHLHG